MANVKSSLGCFGLIVVLAIIGVVFLITEMDDSRVPQGPQERSDTEGAIGLSFTTMDDQLLRVHEEGGRISQIRLENVPVPLKGPWEVKEVGYDVIVFQGHPGKLTVRLESIVAIQQEQVVLENTSNTSELIAIERRWASMLSEVIEITSIEKFDTEIAKPRPEAVVIAYFHADWCVPCRKLGPELLTIADAHPGKFFVLRVDFDQHPKLIERYQVEVLPLLVKFKDGKEVARLPGYEKDKEKFAGWLGIR